MRSNLPAELRALAIDERHISGRQREALRAAADELERLQKMVRDLVVNVEETSERNAWQKEIDSWT